MFGTLKSNQTDNDPYLIETTRPPFKINEAGTLDQCLQKLPRKEGVSRPFISLFLPRTVIHFIVRVAKNSTKI